ncbi:MAG: replicative DNA helicase [Chloroflexi bacterium]|nr:replicative DNA helicase [Chloroflexota bacterium]MDL1941955.1 replicative DNA helicase [Chloroflexi bacterium CFX2]
MTEPFPLEESTAPASPGVPHSREAEEAVVGAVLINPEVYYDIAQFLNADDFYIHRNKWIWEAFVRLHEQRIPIDLLTLSEELERAGQLTEIGGSAYLTSLVNQVPTSLNAEAYGRIVEENSIRRRMIQAANQIASLAYKGDTIDNVMGEAEKAVFGVSERRTKHDVEPIRSVLSAYYDRIDDLSKRPEDFHGVPTGFYDLDKMLNGLQPSDLLIIAGRPGQGKTGFLLSIAKNAGLTHKKHIAIFSLEMSNEQVVQRLIAQETGIDSQRLRTGKLMENEWPLFTHAIEVFSDTHIFLDDTPAITPLQLRTKCRRLHMEYGLDLVIVDYLQLMGGDIRTDNRVQEVSQISRSLKVLARELNVPVLTAAQLSRAVEQRTDKRPVLSDLRESGCLAGDTLIALENGRHVPIRELEGKTNFNIWALNPASLKLEPMPVSRAFCTGIKPVFRMRTRLGREIRATGNHQFLTISGWKRLDELTTDDYIALPRVLPVSATEQTMSNAELALLGHLIGDGCTLPRHVIQYTTREKDLAETVANLAVEVFGGEVKPRVSPERKWYQVYLSSTRQHTHNVHSAVTEWLEELKSFGLRSYEKRIPSQVFEQPNEAIALFLRHLWATDGSIQLVKGKKFRPIAYYATSSPGLAQDVQTLLLRLGINAILKHVSQNGRGRDQYNVIVTGKSDLEIFAEKIGAVGEYKRGRLAEILDHIDGRVANTNRDVIPHNIWRMHVAPAMQRIGITSRQMQAAIEMQYCGTGLYKQNVSREGAARVTNVVKSHELALPAESDVYWDSIISIEPDGEEQVYDLTVPGHHNFAANNIIVHNSLEQDADIVMFIYRPDQYEKDTDKQNIAQIIVAKHRNGPVGEVELIFRGALAKFENAATKVFRPNE